MSHGTMKYTLKAHISYFVLMIEEIQQPSIDFDICNLSSSGDVVYKER